MKTTNVHNLYEKGYYLDLGQGHIDDATPVEAGWAGVIDNPEDCDVIYDWDELTELNAQHERFAALGWHDDYKVVFLDFDFSKSDHTYEDITFASSLTDEDGRPHIIETKTDGNVHIPVLVEDLDGQCITSRYDWIDVKGSAAKGAPSWVVSMFNSVYEWFWPQIVDDHDTDTEFVPVVKPTEIEDTVQLDKEPVCRVGERVDRSETDHDFDDIRLPIHTTDVVDSPVGTNCEHPFHGSKTSANFKLDDDQNTWACWSDRHDVHHVTGGPYHLIGMEAGILECGEWVGSDEHYAGKRDEIKEYCEEHGYETPKHWDGYESLLVADDIHTDLAEGGLDTHTHATIQGTARSGKSYGVIKRAMETREDDMRDVYIAPTHEEALATIEKYKQFGIKPGYFVGEEHARSEYDVSVSGKIDVGKEGTTPQEAAHWDNCNAYQSYVNNVVDEDVIVTVPELLHKIEDYDRLIATEEAAIKRLMATPVPIISISQYKSALSSDDRSVDGGLPRKKVSTCRDIMEEIDGLERTDEIHGAIYEACRAIVDISEMIVEWVPADWEGVLENWEELVDKVEDRLAHMERVQVPSFDKVFTRLQNYNRVDQMILNTLYYDGTLQYGNSDNDRRQMFYIGDPEMPYKPIDPTTTLWLAGNSIPTMTYFHDIVHGDPPDPIGYKNDFEPLRRALDDNVVVKYSGRDNQNQQSHDIEETIRQIKMLSIDSPSALIVSGSSRHTARNAESIPGCRTPSNRDDLKHIRKYLTNDDVIAIPENSQFSEGVDIPEAQMGAIYNGHFAAPFEEYVKEKTGDPTLLRSERVRAAQNAALRSSNIPTRTDGVIGTGKTPQLVPSYHVPDEIFAIFEAYDITVKEYSELAEMRRMLISILDLEAREYEGDIVHPDDLPPRIKKFEDLMEDDSAPAD